MDAKYEVVIWWSKEDDCYLAEVPELPGCIADEESLPEVAAAIEEEIKLWIDVNKKRGIVIPEPKGRLMYA
ncbi:MAG: type II toxin-antitoxin system HicB family antitoxin [Ruminococcus sp.]|jgi:predicted RNase H-like HicB family nuclease|uniref:Type II toxin-antitoxin system HicB family antitoxin n=1 Tax=Schaedlerella arabinosiphila TaxID=2044587 RepID=A0A426DBR5_9FIRM|nr:type II toxin-antitoxin system HicB family antitoxin [Schaedlerella arabinosiphila]MCI8723217.1 type II toxin-antitoxin system HicB family antitoxin [Ruminococcus sp.]RRK30201.1 type II toxin-antitoxin system HicB family antitoxin [Schaedlerella arabinosiphila]